VSSPFASWLNGRMRAQLLPTCDTKCGLRLRYWLPSSLPPSPRVRAGVRGLCLAGIVRLQGAVGISKSKLSRPECPPIRAIAAFRRNANLSSFRTPLPLFRNNEKPEAKGLWLQGTTACRVNQLDFLQHLIPTGAGDRALGCRCLSPIRWGKSWGGTRISAIVRFQNVIGIRQQLQRRSSPDSPGGISRNSRAPANPLAESPVRR